MIIEMAEAWSDIAMGTNMKVSLKIISHMVKVFTHGLMVKFMKVSGNKGLKKDKVFGKASLVTHILVSGHKVKLMGMVFISGKMVIDMKVNGNFV